MRQLGHVFMGTTSSSLSSLVQPLTLTGVSQYSSDFQSILNRQVQIADLPLEALQQQDSTVLSEQATLNAFTSPINNLANSIRALGTLAQNQALSATSSDNSLVTAQATGATNPASYTFSNITSIATAASETTSQGYADSSSSPVSSTGSLNLVVGTTTYPISLSPANNNLLGLENAINGLGAGVTASILTTGTGATPNYLSVTGNTTGHTTLQLIDDPVSPTNANGANRNLLTSHNQGTDAVFQLNGVPVDKSSNTVNDVVPGLTFNIVAPTIGNQTVTVSLASDPSQLTTDIQTFVNAYNAVRQQVQAQHGTSAGALAGDPTIQEISQSLQSLTTYQGTAGIKSLSDLGITLDSTGTMSFDPTVIDSFSESRLADAFQYFGSATSGFGGLAAQFNQITDPVGGLITLQNATYTAADQRLQGQIADLSQQINAMQTALSQRLAAADSLVAELQSEQQMVNASVQSVDLVLYGRNNVSF